MYSKRASLTCVLMSLLLTPVYAQEAKELLRSPVVDAIEAIDALGGTYSYRQPSKEARAKIKHLGYDPRCFWEIGRITLGPASGQGLEPITDKDLTKLHAHMLTLGSIVILDLDHTEISSVGLASLPPLLKLRRLRIDGTKTGKGLAAILDRFPALETLEVANTDLRSEEWVKILKKNPKLKVKRR